MTSKEYRALLRDPRWIAFRKEVIDLDGRACSSCGRSDEKTRLHVHHESYADGRLPWEYPLSALVTLCAGCHAREHGIIPPRDGWQLLDIEDLEDLVGTCEACSEPIRYVHTVFHPAWGTLDVGVICCDNMTDTVIASEGRRLADRLERFVASTRWKPHRRAGWQIQQSGFRVITYPTRDGVRIRVNNVCGRRSFASEQAARRYIFAALHEGAIRRFFEAQMRAA